MTAQPPTHSTESVGVDEEVRELFAVTICAMLPEKSCSGLCERIADRLLARLAEVSEVTESVGVDEIAAVLRPFAFPREALRCYSPETHVRILFADHRPLHAKVGDFVAARDLLARLTAAPRPGAAPQGEVCGTCKGTGRQHTVAGYEGIACIPCKGTGRAPASPAVEPTGLSPWPSVPEPSYPGGRTKEEWEIIAKASFERAAHLPED